MWEIHIYDVLSLCTEENNQIKKNIYNKYIYDESSVTFFFKFQTRENMWLYSMSVYP